MELCPAPISPSPLWLTSLGASLLSPPLKMCGRREKSEEVLCSKGKKKNSKKMERNRRFGVMVPKPCDGQRANIHRHASI